MPELTYNAGANAIQMARLILGRDATVTGATFTGNPLAAALLSGGNGVMLATDPAAAFSENSGANALADAPAGPAFLEIGFIPDSAAMSLRFEVASGDVPDASGPIFHDAVGVWVNGVRVPLALAPRDAESDLVENPFPAPSSEPAAPSPDGLSATMTLAMALNAGVMNSIRIGLAYPDEALGGATMTIAAASPDTLVTAGNDYVTVVAQSSTTVDLLANDTAPGQTELFITHINGQEVVAGDMITLSTGQIITVNEDGTVTITADADIETVEFNYTVATGVGNSQITDIGFVTIETVPCFVAGTLIRTDRGETPVESLKPGDRVLTRDDGMQPLRWIGTRRVSAEGNMAPVRIDRNTFGRHDAVSVSPLHRILVENAHAELLFGSHEVLIAAKDLIDGCRVRQMTGGEVTYIHLLFDRHQVVWSNGLPSESFLPGPQTTGSFEADMVAEIRAIFPHIDPATGAGYGPAARPALKRYEARLLVA